MAILTLLTDFGTSDYYVGAVKGTVLRLLGRGGDTVVAVQIVDLSHDLPAGDVEAAADLLTGAAPTFPPETVHLAVVDPGVGSERRILAVRAAGHLFVAPDNGLLTPFLPAADDPGTGSGTERTEVRHVTRTELFLPGPGSTFHGRDRFAPAAAALLRKEPLDGLGPQIDDPVRLDLPAPRRERTGSGTVLHGRVRRIDRFGNLVTDLPVEWLGGPGWGGGRVYVGEHATHTTARWVGHYAELPPGEPGALIGSLGTVELSLRGRNLAEHWRVERGAAVRIELPSPTG